MISSEQADLLTKAINRLATALERNNDEVAHLRTSLSHANDLTDRSVKIMSQLERAVDQNAEATRRLVYR